MILRYLKLTTSFSKHLFIAYIGVLFIRSDLLYYPPLPLVLIQVGRRERLHRFLMQIRKEIDISLETRRLKYQKKEDKTSPRKK